MMFTQICSNLSWDPEDRQSHTNTSLMGLTLYTHSSQKIDRKVSSDHQACIYLIQSTAKAEQL